MDDAQRFARLYGGRNSVRGTYTSVKEAANGSKVEMNKARTVRETLTLKLFQDHLAGKVPLGCAPIDAMGQCSWACVDIDQYYGLPHSELSKIAIDAGYPVVGTYSKSNGLHLWLFVKVPVDAKLMKETCKEIAKVVGHPNAEIFPKQTQLTKEGLANWVNLPYYGEHRVCITETGKLLDLKGFLDLAEERALNPDLISKLGANKKGAVKKQPGPPDFEDGPPCLQTLADSPQHEYLHNLQMAYAVFAKKKFPTRELEKITEWDAKFRDPGGYAKVNELWNSVKLKDYDYDCDEQPLCGVCQKDVCRTRKYGKFASKGLTIMFIEVYKDSAPARFRVTMSNGQALDCTYLDLSRSDRYGHCVMNKLKRAYMVKNEIHMLTVDSLLQAAPYIEIPEEEQEYGEFKEHLSEYFTNSNVAEDKAFILDGKPYRNPNTNRFEFTIWGLKAYLERQKYRATEVHELTRALRALDGENHKHRIRGRPTLYWSMPDVYGVLEDAPMPVIEGHPI